jgi:hypothetical protein
MKFSKQFNLGFYSLLFLYLSSLVGTSCSSGSQTDKDSANSARVDLKQKELELKEKELELKERELAMKSKTGSVSSSGEKASAPQQSSDHKSPEWVVGQVFIAAKTRNFHLLDNLCDPQGQGDGQTRAMCELSTSGNSEFESAFISSFEFGKVNGSAEISGDRAIVPIKFGPYGDKEETFRLVKRGNRWYLSSI